MKCDQRCEDPHLDLGPGEVVFWACGIFISSGGDLFFGAAGHGADGGWEVALAEGLLADAGVHLHCGAMARHYFFFGFVFVCVFSFFFFFWGGGGASFWTLGGFLRLRAGFGVCLGGAM